MGPNASRRSSSVKSLVASGESWAFWKGDETGGETAAGRVSESGVVAKPKTGISRRGASAGVKSAVVGSELSGAGHEVGKAAGFTSDPALGHAGSGAAGRGDGAGSAEGNGRTLQVFLDPDEWVASPGRGLGSGVRVGDIRAWGWRFRMRVDWRWRGKRNRQGHGRPRQCA